MVKCHIFGVVVQRLQIMNWLKDHFLWSTRRTKTLWFPCWEHAYQIIDFIDLSFLIRLNLTISTYEYTVWVLMNVVYQPQHCELLALQPRKYLSLSFFFNRPTWLFIPSMCTFYLLDITDENTLNQFQTFI